MAVHRRTGLHRRERPDRPLLDTVRWIAAATVALGHGASLVLAREARASGTFDPVAFLVDLRGPAVLLFFVISGYLVGGGVLVRGPRFRWRPYFAARFARIYIVLAPAILLIAALDWTAWAIDPASPVYGGAWQPHTAGGEPAVARYGAANWIATLFSLESWVARPIGTGNALWSLGYEWVFYLAFPLMTAPLSRYRSLWWPLLPVSLMLALLVASGGKFHAAYFAIWVAGAYARVLTEHAHVPRAVQAAGVALALASLVAAHLLQRHQLTFLAGVGAAVALSRFGPGERALFPRVDRLLADRSYSLYVTHFPVMMAVVFCANRLGWVSAAGLPPGLALLALIVTLAVAATLVAIAFGRAFEDRTDALRRWLDGGAGRVAAGMDTGRAGN